MQLALPRSALNITISCDNKKGCARVRNQPKNKFICFKILYHCKHLLTTLLLLWMNWSLIPCLNQSHTPCCAIFKTNCYSNFIGWCSWMETYKLTGWPLDLHWKLKVYIKLSLTIADKNSSKSYVSLGKNIRLRLFYLKLTSK